MELFNVLVDIIKSEESSRYDVNVRSIIAFRQIGKGVSHIETFNRIMNMPPPYTHSTYDDTVKDVLPGYVAAMNDSMLGAASNVKLQATIQDTDIHALSTFVCSFIYISCDKQRKSYVEDTNLRETFFFCRALYRTVRLL